MNVQQVKEGGHYVSPQDPPKDDTS